MPVYCRLTTKDLRVVGHIMAMILDWCGHVNVESAANEKSVLYLYDYLFKGIKKILAEARRVARLNGDSSNFIDEVQLFVRGRMLCSMDACHRALGYCNYPAQSPKTISVSIKLFTQMNYYLNANKVTDMLVYMNRPPVLHQLKFCEFFKSWHYQLKPPATNSRAQSHVINITGINKPIYIMTWIIQSDRYVRITMVHPNVGELWYLRLIMINRPIISENDAYCFPPIGHPLSFKYASFQGAALAAGLLMDSNEGFVCFTECVHDHTHTPAALRALFVMLTLDGSPTFCILKEKEFVLAMVSDYDPFNVELAIPDNIYNKLLKDFIRRLAFHSKLLEDYGLHIHPVTGVAINLQNPTELEEVRSNTNSERSLAELHELNNSFPDTDEQTLFLNRFKVRSNTYINLCHNNIIKLTCIP
jgi:hypothetical protein